MKEIIPNAFNRLSLLKSRPYYFWMVKNSLILSKKRGFNVSNLLVSLENARRTLVQIVKTRRRFASVRNSFDCGEFTLNFFEAICQYPIIASNVI
jgi:hypothetical protein